MATPAPRRVVSHKVFVKPHKIGEVRVVGDQGSQYDAATASRIEETPVSRAYVRGVGLAPPPPPPLVPPLPLPLSLEQEPLQSTPVAPPEEKFSPPSPSFEEKKSSNPRPQTDEELCCGVMHKEGLPYVGVFIFFLSMVLASFVFMEAPNREYVLVGTSWTFQGKIATLRDVTHEGWTFPANAKIASSRMRPNGKRSVFDHVENVTREVVQTRQVLDFIENVCKDSITGYTPEREAYDHTEQLCYDDGTCEEKDVFAKIPSEPIYSRSCVDKPHFRTESYTYLIWEPKDVMREEDVMQWYYTYTIPEWVPVRSVSLDSARGDTVDQASADILEEDLLYVTRRWTYFAHGTQDARTHHAQFSKWEVSAEEYNYLQDKIGQKIIK